VLNVCLEMTDLGKRYRGTWALRRCSLVVPKQVGTSCVRNARSACRETARRKGGGAKK